jgi:hypothetical protein
MKRLAGELANSLKDLLKTLSASQDVFRKHVLPIYEDNKKGQPELFGTALVVRHRGEVFLVSAKHVFEPLADRRELYVYCTPSMKRHLGGNLTWTRSELAVDPVDIGVLKLEGEGIPPYPEVNCVPLPSQLLEPGTSQREGKYYLAVGYPSSRSKIKRPDRIVRAEPYANFGPAISTDRLKKLGLDPQLHIGIAFHKKRVIGISGNIQSFPDPSGMSGSPLYLLYDERQPENVWGAFKVAGILIEYRAKPKVLVATDIAVALKLMDESLGS